MPTFRKTPPGLSLVGQRVLVGVASMGGLKSRVIVLEDKEILLGPMGFQRFLLCRNEETGLASDVLFRDVILKPGDAVRAHYPEGVKPPPLIDRGVDPGGFEFEVYPAAPAGEFILVELTERGHFIVRKHP